MMTLTIRAALLWILITWPTQALADLLPGNFLPNPSVERDDDLDGIPDGWSLGGNDPTGDIWDDTRPVTGVRNLLLFDTGDDNYTSWYTNVDIPAGTDELEFRWTWAYEFTGDNPNDTFRMTVAWRSGASDIGFTHITVTDDQPEYITQDEIFVVPEGSDALRLEFVTGGSQTETGVMYIDDISIAIPGAPLVGDFNQNGMLDSADIDMLTDGIAHQNGNNPVYDLNGDALNNEGDIRYWIKDLYNSWIGDSNLDQQFNSSDLVNVLAAGKYEGGGFDSVWTTGDFNGDGQTTSTDLVAALADGGYEQGPRAAISAVPEPCGVLVLALGMLGLGLNPQRCVPTATGAARRLPAN